MTRAWPVDDIEPRAPLADNARRILAVRVAEYYAYEPVVADERAIEALHNLRIAAKRLRYTLELFTVVFTETGERLVERVRAIQELLGQLHDHDVRIALIADELATLAAEQTTALGRQLAEAPAGTHGSITAAALRPPPDDPRRGLLALLGRQYTSRHETYLAFLEQWRQDHADGMRRDLVFLSVPPDPVADSPRGI